MYKVTWEDRALSDLSFLPFEIASNIKKKIEAYLVHEPRKLSKVLTDKYIGQWRYRYGDYRVTFVINERKRLIKVLRVGYRKDIYEK